MPSLHRDELDRLHALVDHLGYDLEPSILIGGRATWLRVEGDISRDIDLIINSEALRSTLKETLTDYSETRPRSRSRRCGDSRRVDSLSGPRRLSLTH